MTNSRRMSRRTVLRGAGVAIGLPWLEAMLPRSRGAEGTRASAAPRRFVFIYTPNGYWQPTFVPSETGRDWQPPPSLESLAELRDDVTVITGLDRVFVPGTGVHAQAGACWLTSSPPSETLDGGFPTNITIDQLLARQLGGDVPLPSLELSTNDFTDNKETRYFETISWYGPGYAPATEKNPRSVFQRMFGRPAGDAATASVLDAALDDARALERRLGYRDRAKLDEFTESLRAVERRIQLAEQAARRIQRPPLAEPTGIPEDRGAYLRLMFDLVVAAFELDLTRVATLVVDPERWDSPRTYHGVFDAPQNHHGLTHTKGEDAKARLARIDRFHVEQYAYLVRRLRDTRDGDARLLDRTAAVMGSGISEGDSHDYGNLNVLLAGRAGGLVSLGRHLNYEGDVPLGNLWLTLLQGVGIERKSFADSTGTLKELG